jgi:hypothetical protein
MCTKYIYGKLCSALVCASAFAILIYVISTVDSTGILSWVWYGMVWYQELVRVGSSSMVPGTVYIVYIGLNKYPYIEIQ